MSTKGKGRGRKGMKRGGGSKSGGSGGHGGGRGGGGGEESFLPDVSDGFVEVLFVEPLVRFFKSLDNPDDVIPATFLHETVEECYRQWQSYFPGLGVDDLVAHAVPRITAGGCTFRDWGGTILVELRDARADLSLISQLTNSKIEALQAKATLQEDIAKVDQKVEAATKKLLKASEIAKKVIHDLVKQQASDHENFRKEMEEFKKNQQEINEKLIQRDEELMVAHKELKRQVLLTNQIKQRTVLERARLKVIQLLGKPSLEVGQKWKDFFESFLYEDWKSVFGAEENDFQKMDGVKRLLASGSLQSNKHIHELDLNEIYYAIFAVEVAHEQDSWIWLLAFTYSMTEEQVKDLWPSPHD